MLTLGKIKYGEASKLRILKDGYEYDPLFEKAPGQFYTIKKNAGLSDTVKFIPQVVRKTYAQTFKISQRLKDSSVYQACKNIWQFVYEHIQYRKDEQGYEQIRSPRRTWHDRKQGVDCDCYSVFISSILTNLGIPHILRITKYNQDHFQHIYPIVPYNGKYITIDCVTDKFDYEVPFSVKRDYPMELQFLDGIPDYDGVGDLGKLFKKKNKGGGSPSGSAPGKKKKKGFFKKVGGALKKVASVVNKVNPAAVLLRNGLLLALKLNVKNLSSRLHYAYMTKEQAAQHNISSEQHDKLQSVRKKLESIFSTAGGKVSNLGKAIAAGKAKRDKKKKKKGMSGLGYADSYDNHSLNAPLEELLGHDIYYSENVEGLNGIDAMDGLGELGEPVSALLAAATAAIGALSTMIGKIFKGKAPNEDFTEEANQAADSNQPLPDPAQIPAAAQLPEVNNSSASANLAPVSNNESAAMMISNSNEDSSTAQQYSESSEQAEGDEQESDSAENNLALTKVANNAVAKTGTPPPDDKDSFWKKKWVKPAAIIGGSVLLLAIAAKAFGSGQNKSSPRGRSLDGIPRDRKNHKRKKKHKHHKKHAVPLL